MLRAQKEPFRDDREKYSDSLHQSNTDKTEPNERLAQGRTNVPIDKAAVTSDLTLEIDEKSVTVSEFVRAVDSFIGLVKEIANVAAPGRDPTAWLVNVYPGSVGIGLRAQGGAYSEQQVAAIRSTVINGLRGLSSSERNPLFSDKAIEYSKDLGQLLSRKKEEMAVRVFAGSGAEETVDLSKATVKGAKNILAPVYDQIGSVEGIVKTISTAHNQREFIVYDTVTENGITCYVTDEALLKRAMSTFRQRVEVHGIVRYRADGQPVSVAAKHVISFPPDSEIPTLDEMRNLLRGA